MKKAFPIDIVPLQAASFTCALPLRHHAHIHDHIISERALQTNSPEHSPQLICHQQIAHKLQSK
eukprot:scaffold6038_cov108-Skeletonema_marinoi.AAC.4